MGKGDLVVWRKEGTALGRFMYRRRRQKFVVETQRRSAKWKRSEASGWWGPCLTTHLQTLPASWLLGQRQTAMAMASPAHTNIDCGQLRRHAMAVGLAADSARGFCRPLRQVTPSPTLPGPSARPPRYRHRTVRAEPCRSFE